MNAFTDTIKITLLSIIAASTAPAQRYRSALPAARTADGLLPALPQPYPVSRQVLRDIATQYHNWVQYCSRKSGAPLLEAPEEEKREHFVTPYFRGAQPDQIVAILKAREPAPILVSIGQSATEQGPLLYKRRWVDQYNFYIYDRAWGRMFVRFCPYFPFPARVYLKEHYWLAQRLQERGIRFLPCANAFLRCSDPQRLQQLADSLQPQDITRCAQEWLTYLVPFFTGRERRQAGVQHRLAQVEYGDNLIFKRRAALDRLGERLLDAIAPSATPIHSPSSSVAASTKATRVSCKR